MSPQILVCFNVKLLENSKSKSTKNKIIYQLKCHAETLKMHEKMFIKYLMSIKNFPGVNLRTPIKGEGDGKGKEGKDGRKEGKEEGEGRDEGKGKERDLVK